jgi:hypothetical protein
MTRVVCAADIAAAAGGRAEVIGIYTPTFLGTRASPRPGTVLVHVAVTLDDGTRVLLEPPWHAAARRTAEERAAYDGQRVRAIGTLFAMTPEAIEGAATPRLPCLVAVELITAG